MYKLFLTIRYLTRKAIVVFPILVVWLCVAMMIIVTSIMGGFVERVRQANRELMGDIIVECPSRAGWGHYEELAAELAKMDFIEITTPVVRAYGLFNVGSANVPVQVIGIDPVGRAKVSSFHQSLYRQFAAPREAAEDLGKGGYPVTGEQLVERARRARDAAEAEIRQLDELDAKIGLGKAITGSSWNFAWAFAFIPLLLCEWLLITLTFDNSRSWRIVWAVFPATAVVVLVGLMALPMIPHSPTAADKDHLDDAFQQNAQRMNRATRALRLAEQLPASKQYNSSAELLAALLPAAPSFNPYPAPRVYAGESAPPPGCIVGADLGLYGERDRRGNYDRKPYLDNPIGVLTVAPIVPGGGVLFTPQQQQVRVVDDSYSKVFEVDSSYVYVPFDVAQKLALMTPWEKEDGTGMTPARISELQIKVKNGDDPAALQAAKLKIANATRQLMQKYAGDFDTTNSKLRVQTWDEKQARYISAVVNEKRMITFILVLMSLVVEVVIFLIFYQIVRDKTRDIGIIKAIGGSASGVAGIFVMYGLLIGVVGGALGVALGVEFVWHTNEIHEWIYQTTGLLIWNRSVYLFDRIPDVVNWWEVLMYFVAAVLSGVIGAAHPALRAGRQDPVKAVRYE